jgi:predicted AAA+ superfamily ATPase
VHEVHLISLDDLLFLDRQKAELVRNTEQFLAGRPANDALLWGARGTGKSSLIKALFNRFRPQGLRLIQVDRADLIDLPEMVDRVRGSQDKYLLYCDDLSFEADDASFKALKSVLEGSIFAPPNNLLLYASSNRRHLLPEYQSENLDCRVLDGEVHFGETVEETISLSDRFGIWLSFHPFNQEQYLQTVFHWLHRLSCPVPEQEVVRGAALQWALRRGSRSGRTAWQFARDWSGQHGS